VYSYPIDYDLFEQEEVVKLIEFLSLIEDANERIIDIFLLSDKHKEFQQIVNSKSLEKKIDRDFEKVSGFSIYKTIKKYKNMTSK
jgi:uncharacterized protein YktA (UPF0223 family)